MFGICRDSFLEKHSFLAYSIIYITKHPRSGVKDHDVESHKSLRPIRNRICHKIRMMIPSWIIFEESNSVIKCITKLNKNHAFGICLDFFFIAVIFRTTIVQMQIREISARLYPLLMDCAIIIRALVVDDI